MLKLDLELTGKLYNLSKVSNSLITIFWMRNSKKCKNRLFILDEDILIAINKSNDIISEKLLYDLNKLSSYENNVVFILSKESKSYMYK